MKEYEYYIFDFDGTISDTVPGIKNCIKYACEFYNIPIDDDKNLDFFVGPPLFVGFKTVFGVDDELSNKLVEKYRERYKVTAADESFLYPEVKEMLSTLKKKGKKLAVASSKPTPFIIAIAEKLGIKDYFDTIVGETFGHNESSKKDLINEAFENLGATDKSKAVMVGDRFYDIEGAKGAGVDGIGAVYGFGNEKELIDAGAVALLHKPSDLLDF